MSKKTASKAKASVLSGSKRKEYIDKLTTQLRKWDGELDELQKTSDKKISDVKLNLNQKIQKLRERRDEFKNKLNKLEDVSDEAYHSLKADIDKLWKNIKDSFEVVRKELKK